MMAPPRVLSKPGADGTHKLANMRRLGMARRHDAAIPRVSDLPGPPARRRVLHRVVRPCLTDRQRVGDRDGTPLQCSGPRDAVRTVIRLDGEGRRSTRRGRSGRRDRRDRTGDRREWL